MKELKPKEFPFIVVEPGRKLFILSITGKPAAYAYESAGFHHKLVDMLAAQKVSVLRAYKQLLPEGFEWVFFIDVSQVENLEGFLDSFRKLPEVVSVKWAGPEQDVIVDVLHFPMTSRGGVRMIIFSAEMLSKVLTELYRVFGTGASFILYKLGFDFGDALASHFKRMLTAASGGIELPPRKIIEVFLIYSMSAGWQIPEKVEISEEDRIKALVRVRELWEALARKDLDLEVGCDLFRGILAGFFTNLYGVRFKAVEVKCAGRSAPHCEFHLTEEG